MDYKKIYKRIEKRYIMVAIILILLFTFRQVVIQFQINHEKNVSSIINISGRQRMLSQKIVKDILIISKNEDKDIRDLYLEDLKSSLDLWQRSHYNLIEGSKEEGLNSKNSEKIISLFEEINPYFENMFASANRILNTTKKEAYNNDSILKEVEIINDNEKLFLEKMDQIVCQYDIEAKNAILLIEKTELVLFSLIVFSVFFITIFVFIPASKTLRYAFIDTNESNENIKKLFYTMKGLFFLINEDGDIITMNSDARELIGVGKLEDKNINIKRAIKWKNLNIADILNETSLGEQSNNIEAIIEDKNGKNLTMLVSAIGGKYNRKNIILISAFDITAQKKAEDILRNMAIKDELTGLYNRHFLESIIEGEIERSRRYDYPLSAAILDIDNFKKINDKWGHPVGDIILKKTADILNRNLRQSDYLIRIGGEEFVVLMPHTNLEGAYIVAQKLRVAIENIEHTLVGKYTISFGVAECKIGETYNELYDRMDDALYNAKNMGRNRVVKSIVDEDVQGDYSQLLEWKDSWNSGDKLIDFQHKEIFTILNKMIKNPDKEKCRQQIIGSFNTIIKNVEEHFIYEEKVLQSIEYIDLLEHKNIHQDLLKKVYKLKESFINEETTYEDLLEFMFHDLIIGHLLKDDVKFFSFIKNKPSQII